MIERYVFVRLKEEYSTEQGRADVVQRTLDDLRELPGVLGISVGTPADEHAGKGWDISIAVSFEHQDHVKPYLDHPAHRAYVDEFLKPRLKVIKYWNFDVSRWQRTPRAD
jgi:hypothetical protein